MGNQVLFADGQQAWLDNCTGRVPAAMSWTVKLFVNNLTPTYGTTVLGDFVEASFAGYSAAGVSGLGTPVADYPYYSSPASPNLWVCTGPGGGPETVYGYYIVENTGPKLHLAERFTTPIVITDIPDYIYLRPIFRLESFYHLAYPSEPLVGARIQPLGRFRWLKQVLNLSSTSGYYIHLFKNALANTDQLVISDITESNYPGYAAQGPGVWTVPIYNPVSGFYESNCGNKFFFTSAGGGAQSAYGYYLTEGASGDLILAERFNTPFDMSNNGDLTHVLPAISAFTKFIS